MKAYIVIGGGIQGSHIIYNKLKGYDDEVRSVQGAYIRLSYSTKAKARKALKQAFKELKEEEPEYNRIYMKQDHLFYDASKAYVIC